MICVVDFPVIPTKTMEIQTAFNSSLDFFIVSGFVALQRKRMKQKKTRLSEKNEYICNRIRSHKSRAGIMIVMLWREKVE